MGARLAGGGGSTAKFRVEVMSRWEGLVDAANEVLQGGRGFAVKNASVGYVKNERAFVPVFLVSKMTADLLLELRDLENALLMYEALVIYSKDHEQYSAVMALYG